MHHEASVLRHMLADHGDTAPSRFSFATFGAPRSTRDTVMIDTPVARAMSLSVGCPVVGMMLA